MSQSNDYIENEEPHREQMINGARLGGIADAESLSRCEVDCVDKGSAHERNAQAQNTERRVLLGKEAHYFKGGDDAKDDADRKKEMPDQRVFMMVEDDQRQEHRRKHDGSNDSFLHLIPPKRLSLL